MGNTLIRMLEILIRKFKCSCDVVCSCVRNENEISFANINANSEEKSNETRSDGIRKVSKKK